MSFDRGQFFSKANFLKIVDLVRDRLEGDYRGGKIKPELQVAAAVRSWARNEVCSLDLQLAIAHDLQASKTNTFFYLPDTRRLCGRAWLRSVDIVSHQETRSGSDRILFGPLH